MGVTIVSLFRQQKRIGSLLGRTFSMSGGPKHEQAGVAWLTLPPLVVGTFKLQLFVLGYGDKEFFTEKK